MVESKIVLELTLNEAKILCKTIQGYSPQKADEVITFFLYNRISKKIEEANGHA